MIKLLLFLRKGRFRKKWQVYKRLWLISFDLTILFYVLLFLGYVVSAIILEGSFLENFNMSKFQLRTIQLHEVGLLITVLPLFYLFRSFLQPGILFSSTEYTVTMLTFSRKQVWHVLALERWLKLLLILTVTGTVYALFSATPLHIVAVYLGILIGMNLLMTVIEWKVFQYPLWVKILLFMLVLAVNAGQVLLQTAYVTIVFIVGLLVLNLLFYQRLLHHIDWQKVTAAVDFKMWNMPLISHATKTKFKKNRAYTMWQRMNFWKQPFDYTKLTVYHRLWQLYFTKNFRYILQIAGALLLLLTVFGYLKPWLFLVGIFITAEILANLSAAMFRDRLETDIVQILPWRLAHYRQTFLLWIFPASGLFVMPLIVYLLVHFSFWLSALFFMVCLLFGFLVNEKIQKVMHQLEPDRLYQEWIGSLVYIGFIFVVLSHFHPLFVLGIGGIILVVLFAKRRKYSFAARV